MAVGRRVGHSNCAWLSGKELFLQRICPAPCQSKAHRNTCSNCVHLQVMLTGHCTADSSLDGQVVGQKLVLPLLALAGTELCMQTDRHCLHHRLWCAASPVLAQGLWDHLLLFLLLGQMHSGQGLEICQIFSAAGQWLLASPHKGRAEVRAARLILQPGCETAHELSSGVMME